MRLTISGSDSSFFLPTIKSTSLSIKTPAFALPELNTKLLSTTHLPKCVLSTRYPIDSFKVKAIIDDGFVAEAMEVSFYELLGIPKSGTLLEIKHAYKQLARKYHPDVSPPDRVEEYTRRFIRVHEAYETLSDPRRRALYDRDMAKGLHLVFSARKCYQKDEGMENKSEWKNRWQNQLSVLKRRNVNKDVNNMSWGARMRQQRDELANECK